LGDEGFGDGQRRPCELRPLGPDAAGEIQDALAGAARQAGPCQLVAKPPDQRVARIRSVPAATEQPDHQVR